MCDLMLIEGHLSCMRINKIIQFVFHSLYHVYVFCSYQHNGNTAQN